VPHLGGRVLDHRESEVLEFVASLGIAGAFGIGDMAQTAGHLHDESMSFEEKVDPCDVATVGPSLHGLSRGPRKPELSYDSEERTLEW